ncbi:substrate-binding domain-containing protein [Salisediminibacterium halotolerans]|uniref:Tungstate transport system substrate-binding protein n=1 Tax=Salisediminibacterium halotolerans TaxID=517425 RepID=A0A1H9SJV9_9BACI|nr:substrate-binding domain-containing protein [Salisediminibacterium haloalkalitolerans]SER85251.1 tungstate transport system substrate-binding protein [Salisediminibacterium haloalkalitolerans]
MKRFFLLLTPIFLTACWVQSESSAEEKLLLATTTSTYDSGLLDELMPEFKERYDVDVDIISVGSGEALMMGANGEADALLTHAPADEEELEKQGDILNRQRVMYNDFIIAGPDSDPSDLGGQPVQDAFQSICNDGDTPFFSRGDDSGTHKRELELWADSSLEPKGSNYQETGQGMGDTLRIAAEKEGYTLTDRGTYLALEDSLNDLTIITEGDEELRNIYHVMQVNPEASKQINAQAAEDFVAFMTSEDTQSIIEDYGESEWGEPLFSPDAEEG